MGITLLWDDDQQTIFYWLFDGPWTWDELFTSTEAIRAALPHIPVEPAAIVHVRRVSIPGGVILNPANIRNAQRVLAMAPDGTGPIVVVGGHRVVRLAFDQLRRLNRRATANIHFAGSLAEARQIIAEQRQPALAEAGD